MKYRRLLQLTINAQYALLYNLDDPNQYLVYRLDEIHHVWDEKEMREHQYTEPHGKYYIYSLKEQVSCPNINVESILKDSNADKGMPLFCKNSELIMQ